MFILVVSRGYAEKNNPMLGIFEMDQALALQKCGHKVILVSIDLRSIRRKRKLGFTHLHKKEIEVYNFSFPLGRVPAQILLWIGRIGIRKLYKRILREHGAPDILHAHFTGIASIAAILKKKNDIPFVITEHSSQINKDKLTKDDIYFGNNSYKYANQVIAVSSALAQRIKQHFNIESIVIPNIVDTSIFKTSNGTHTNFTFISVGSLSYIKGFDLLIDAFHQSNFAKNISLIIIGDGIERKHLEKQIKDLSLTDQIKLLGGMPRESIQQNISSSSVFVLVSRSETFGVAYIEAMACGKPVIATKCGGPEDFVNKTNGLLVDINDTEGLKSALISMFQNIKSYDSKLISGEVNKNFSPESIARKLTQVYNGIKC